MQRFLLSVCFFAALATAGAAFAAGPKVVISTNFGDIQVELNQEAAPKTVANFLKLVDHGFYDGLVFHRVIANFMIQGGGYTKDYTYVPAASRVVNESSNGLRNERGTVAMARLSDPDSADTQFFINVKDNTHLDATPGNPGYTVFGRVVGGMEVVDKIELVNTHLRAGMAAVPEEPVIITSAKRM